MRGFAGAMNNFIVSFVMVFFFGCQLKAFMALIAPPPFHNRLNVSPALRTSLSLNSSVFTSCTVSSRYFAHGLMERLLYLTVTTLQLLYKTVDLAYHCPGARKQQQWPEMLRQRPNDSFQLQICGSFLPQHLLPNPHTSLSSQITTLYEWCPFIS